MVKRILKFKNIIINMQVSSDVSESGDGWSSGNIE